ncbi:MAG: energy transducer TonB [Deltaproteobacteria bacterium]|nr:energy transducer TonB [Deltaproteobacteria bacterium]
MRICVTVSILLHVSILLAFHKTHLFSWELEELKTYEVEIIRPSVDEMDEIRSPESSLENSSRDSETEPPDSQETISLDTKDKRYISYAGLIKEKISYKWKYPKDAREHLLEGRLTAFFSLSKDGKMIEIYITSPSGHEILDREVIRAVKAAAPFPPFPDAIKVSRLNINANFDYRLTARKRKAP